MRVTIQLGNWAESKVTTDLPVVPQIGDLIDVPEFMDKMKTYGGIPVVYQRKWNTKTKGVTVYVRESL
jgi:hypothetical protein